MKLIKPYYEIITPIDGEEILKQIELAARTCYKSEDKIEYDIRVLTDFQTINRKSNNPEELNKLNVKLVNAKSAKTLILKLISRGHEAMLEFGGNITVKFICDRGVSHELVRHRIASFAQESTRYCNYNKRHDISYIIPCWLNIEPGIYDYKKCNEITDMHARYWADCMYNIEHWYNEFISVDNWSPQQARSVLPNSLKTEINISANIREWRHIFKLRTNKAAHPQMRELMCPLLDNFKNQIPILFDDITYEK